MARFKNWSPGEHRVKLQVITEDGLCLEAVIPHLKPEYGQKFLDVLKEVYAAGSERVCTDILDGVRGKKGP